MGASQSFDENIRDKTNTLNIQHADLDVTIRRVEEEATRIIDLILARHYNDRTAVCEKIGWQKVEELSSFFPIETLEGVRYRLGVIPAANEVLEQKRQRVCTDIVNFYLKKINLITNIQKEVPNCRGMEKEIYDGLKDKLRGGYLSEDEWLAVYKELENFNKDIKKRYALMERELERIRLAKNMAELDAIAKTTNTILSDSNTICKTYENRLFQFSNRAEQFRRGERKVVERVEQEMRRGSPIRLERDDLKDLERRIDLEEREVRMFSRSPSPVRSPRVGSPLISPSPSPPPRIPIRSPRSPIRSPPPPRRTVVETVVEEVPVHKRTIRKPVVVSEEVVEEQIPVPKSPAPPKMEKKKLPEIPVETFPEPRLRSPTLVQSPQVVTHVHQHVMQPQAIPPVVPVVRTKQVTVRADRIERQGNTLYLRNPTKVEVTRTVPRDRGVVLTQTPRVVRAEPVLTKTIIRQPVIAPPIPPAPVATIVSPAPVTQVPLLQREQGVPVRATRDHVPRTPGEIPLREGQPTLYLGSAENGWSRVRHADNLEGYVPHSYLSK